MWTLHRGNIWWDKEGNNPWLRLHRVVIWGVVRPHPAWFLGVQCPVSRVETTGLCGHTGRWCRPECRHHCLALPHPTHHSTLAAVAARTSRRSHLYSYITRDTDTVLQSGSDSAVQPYTPVWQESRASNERVRKFNNAPIRDMRVG